MFFLFVLERVSQGDVTYIGNETLNEQLARKYMQEKAKHLSMTIAFLWSLLNYILIASIGFIYYFPFSFKLFFMPACFFLSVAIELHCAVVVCLAHFP